MNQITVEIPSECINDLTWLFDSTSYWINHKDCTYVLYGLPLTVQYELDNSRFTTYNSYVR